MTDPSFSPARRALLAAAAATPLFVSGAARAAEPDLASLRNMTANATPIGGIECKAKLAQAQRLMSASGIGAVLIEPGSSLVYFTGIRWGRSERALLAILPVEGEPCIVSPYFEEPRMRETLGIPAEVRVWQEDEDPLKVVAGFLRDRKLAARPVGIEETVRFFIPDMLARALPGAKIVSANPVVRGCRMIKTSAELSLMQTATDITIAAYRWTWPRIEKGMTGRDIGALMDAATAKLGGDPQFSMALIGEAAAYPHGTAAVHKVADGQIVLMDCGCTVQGYQSDISRTFVFGAASKEQRTVWDRVHQGQQTALAAARIGCRRAVSMTRCGGSTKDSVTARATNSPAVRTVPAMGSGSMDTSRSIWCAAKRPG
jgi:Xaa-Pro aminopeptidase